MKNKDKHEMNAVVTDMDYEKGIHPIGQLVHISTVTHAFRGVLLSVDSSYYVLDTRHPVGIALVDSTGAAGEYFSAPTAVRNGDAFDSKKSKKKFEFRVFRGAGSWMGSWEL